MSSEDYRKGLTGLPGGSGMDYLNGVEERERRRTESRPPPYTGEPAQPAPGPASSGTDWPVGNRSSGVSRPSILVSETLGSMAKGGASLLAVVAMGYLLFTSSTWTWPAMIGYGIGGAAVGAVGGAVLYIALKILAFALKVAGVLLAVGVVLYLFDVIDLPRVLTSISRALGL